MYPRFILPIEKEYNKQFTDGVLVYIYPSSKEVWLNVEKLLKDAVATKKQLAKDNLDDIVGNDYDSGRGDRLIIIKVVEDDS